MPSRIQTFPLSHPRREEVETAFEFGPFETVKHVGDGMVGHCYWNVADRVARSGGTAVLGWKIQYWPGLFVIAVHHSIWRDPDTHLLLDITEKLVSDNLPDITFVADTTLDVGDLSRAPLIPDRHYRLVDNPAVDEYIASATSLIQHQKDLAERLFAAGAIWRPVGGYVLEDAKFPQFRAATMRTQELVLEAESALERCDRLDKIWSTDQPEY